ncbi:hypothetical protein [Aquipuribacter nitratireducens]|uniref:Uncharacterized protein n=1 Tax=Aquipuribacter nitratireducens TaxID=650104 RepID=A0ABW0GPD4_9MICO
MSSSGPSPVTPEGLAGAPGGRAVAVLDRARAALLDQTSASRDLRLAADATLDLTSAHPSGQAVLLSSGRQPVSGLVRDPDARFEALTRLRRYRSRVGVLEDAGHTAGYLVAGVVVLPGAVEVPVLLRRCRVGAVSGSGTDADALVVVHGDVTLNPALVRELARRSAGALDLAAVVGDAVPRPDARGGFDPYPVLDLLQSRLPAVPGAVLRRRLLLAPLSVDDDRIVADLERLRDTGVEDSPLAWLGEDWDQLPADLPVTGSPDPGAGSIGDGGAVEQLLDRFAPVRPDRDQPRVLAAVLAGHSLAVDAPPGTGATTVALAVAAVAAATGRRCLVVTPDRGQADGLQDRLAAHGLLEPDAAAGPDGNRATESSGAVAARHEAAATRYREAAARLLEVRRPWQVSRADVLAALAAGVAEGPRLTSVVLTQDPATALSREQVDALADDLGEAVRLGLLRPDESAWSGARITDRQGAQEALGLARRMRDELVREARAAAGDLAHGTGTARAQTVAQVRDRFRLFSGLQATLDRLVPEVFDMHVLDLVVATADEEFRRSADYAMPLPSRWRLQRRARRLVRPGVQVDDAQLHRLLVAAADQRRQWQEISEGSGWAHLPAATGAMVASLGALVRACDRLDALHPGLRLADRDLDDVQAIATRLAADALALDDLPRRTLLGQRVRERGGEPLLAQLRRLPPGAVDPAGAARELRLAWWHGVAEATAPPTRDRDATTVAAAEHARSEEAWLAGAAARVRASRAALDPRLRLPDPVRVVVPADVAALPPHEHVDVVVLDDAGRTGMPEACGALARGAQVLALGDLGSARPGSALGVLGACLPVDALTASHRAQDPVLAGLPGAAGSHPVRTAGTPSGDPAVTRTVLDRATGLPGGGSDQLDTTEVEVEHVVGEVLRLVAECAAHEPARSVAVLGLTRGHAAAVAAGVRRAVRAYPALADAFSGDRPEPVVVASVDQARGLERDEVLLTTGFARTPHGRVVHRFGLLDDLGGPAVLATALSRARHRLHVVTALRSDDLDPARLRTPGARALREVLEAVEAATSARGDRAAGRAGTEPSGTRGEQPTGRRLGDPVLRVLGTTLTDTHDLEVGAGSGGGLLVRGARGVLVVDVDVDVPDPGALAARRARLAEAGWSHRLVAAELVAADVEGVARGLAEVVGGAPRPAPVTPPVVPEDQAAGEAGDEAADEAADPSAVRRADRVDDPVLPLSPDDSDRGWGEVDVRDADDRDDSILRERPPHW